MGPGDVAMKNRGPDLKERESHVGDDMGTCNQPQCECLKEKCRWGDREVGQGKRGRVDLIRGNCPEEVRLKPPLEG